MRAGKLAVQQKGDERRLTGGVLAEQQDHGLGIKVRFQQERRVELIEQVVLLKGPHLELVHLFEAFSNVLDLPDVHLWLGRKHGGEDA